MWLLPGIWTKEKENSTEVAYPQPKSMKPKKIPKFKSIQEEAEFWDTHSFADYEHEFKPVKLIYKPEPKEAVIHVKVAKKLKEKIEQVARDKDITVSSLIHMWTVEKLKQLSRNSL
jgi:hypothetical protein